MPIVDAGTIALSQSQTLSPSAIDTVLASASLSQTQSLSSAGVGTILASATLSQTQVLGWNVSVAGVTAGITSAASAGSLDTYTLDRSGNVLTLGLQNTVVQYQPGTIVVDVGNGLPNGTAYFFLDGSSSSFYNAALDAAGTAQSVPLPIIGLTSGSHSVLASGASSIGSGAGTSAASTFTVVNGLPVEAAASPQTPAALSTTRWTFQLFDFSSTSSIPSYTFAINPKTLDQTFGGVALTSESPTVYNAPLVSWEGAPRPGTWTVAGTVLQKVDHDALMYWAALNQRIYLTDEFSRRYVIKIEDLKMVRKRNRDYPWHHDYEMSMTVLAGQGVPA